MKLFRIFHIGAKSILNKGCCVPAVVSLVQPSILYVIKKPIRLGITRENTRFSHFISFTYTLDQISYSGKLFLPPTVRCPQLGETITVYYDPEKPENYACRPFGPAANPLGW